MSGLNQAFSELSAFTFRQQDKDITSSIIGLNALWEEISAKGNIKTDVAGGDYIARGVTLLENPTGTNFDGYQPFNIDASESSTIVTVPWRAKAMVVTASGDELARNASAPKLKGLVELRNQVAKDTQQNHMAVEVYGDGSINSSIYGLSYWVQDNGQGSPGGVDSAVYTNWRNKFIEIAGNNAWQGANVLRGQMDRLHAQCSFSGTKPDMWVMTSDMFHDYQSSIRQDIRYAPGNDKTEGSKDVIYHLNAKVVRDTNVNFGATAERAYCLTTKHWELIQHPTAKWTKGAERVPHNQDAIVIPYFWRGNMICKSRRTQGVLLDAA